MLSAPADPLPQSIPLVRALRLLPGLFLAGGVAGLGVLLHLLPGLALFNPMILAMVLGLVLGNLRPVSARCRPGLAFAMRHLLRAGIVLLGLQLTLGQVVGVGLGGFTVIAASLAATFAFTLGLGRLLGVGRDLTTLIAAGTSICGASAIAAVNDAVRAPDEDVAYAMACVTLFGSLAVFLYPLAAGLLDLGPRAFGLWAGASIHEIAQVVAAAYQRGAEAGDFATIAKLARVMLLAPVVLLLGLGRRGRAGRAGLPVPLFVLGFLGLVVVNSVVPVGAGFRQGAGEATAVLLAIALAAMGLEARIGRLRARGLRPLLLGAAAFLFIAGFSLLLVGHDA